jgi:hypothetical protein
VTDEEPKAGLVQKGDAYPMTEATGDEASGERTYRVQANPPDQWVAQEATVKEQARLDAEVEGDDIADWHVVKVEADEPNGVVFVTLAPGAGEDVGDELEKAEAETKVEKVPAKGPAAKK